MSLEWKVSFFLRVILFTFTCQVLVLRELAVSAPTFFFQQVQPFFDNIFYAVWDPKQAIREGAVSALRASLILTTQRETKEMQKPQWYKVRENRSVVQLKISCFIFHCFYLRPSYSF